MKRLTLFVVILSSFFTFVCNHPDSLLSESYNYNHNINDVNLHWMFKNNLVRSIRSPLEKPGTHNKLDDPKCQKEFSKLCGSAEEDNEFAVLECVQNFKVNLIINYIVL